MSADLLKSPRSRAEHLGLPMPDDPHAVSACLPLWSHNIGYEEGDPAVVDRLQAAYPRFCFHPLVRTVCAELLSGEGRSGLPFASRRCAERAIEYVSWRGGSQAEVVELPGQQACGVVVPPDSLTLLKQYWQHAGEIVSSRVAERLLADQPTGSTDTTARRIVRERVAGLHDIPPENVFLFPSGMAAIAAAWRLATHRRPNTETCQFGFPYVDTLKIQERFRGAARMFFPQGSTDDLATLEQKSRTTTLSAIFCEVPTNPLLMTPDVQRLRMIADRVNALLVIDDTLAACGNLKLLPHADIIVTSLTKYFSGYGNVLAGALILNPRAREFAETQRLVTVSSEETLSDPDVEVLERNSRDLCQRMSCINDNATRLADFLKQHPAVESVFYPDLQPDSLYDRLRSPDGGGGGLLSISLNDPGATTATVFDALNVCKGPNLGTNFTLCCPYTLLAHYQELDFAERCGVSRWLLRLSVGTEPFEELRQRFEAALSLSAAQSHA